MLIRIAANLRPASKPVGTGAVGLLQRFASWCAHCHARYEQRRHLADLDDRMLKDVGITTGEAARECCKPWWRA